MVLSLDRYVGKVAVVTGATAGIGAAIAEQLVEKGVNVAGLARRQDRIDEFAKKVAGKKGKFLGIKADLSKEEDILNAFKVIKERLGPVHILVNNAGYGEPSYISDGKTETWRKMFQLNVMGLCIATREAVRDMKANNVEGHIIHINSVAGNIVPAGFPVGAYSASKFAVRALAETLRLELNSLKLKIKITNLSPGLVESELTPPDFKAKIEEMFEAATIIQAENIADAVTYVLSTPPHVQIQQLTITPVKDFLLG